MIKSKIKNKSIDDNIFMFLVNSFLLISFILVAYPLIYVVSASFSSPGALVEGRVWLFPVDFTLAGYKAVFSNSKIMSGFANSLFYLVVGTSVNLVMTMLAAYPLSRNTFSARNTFMVFFVITMLFSGGLIPLYLVVKKLGILNSRMALIIPKALAVWNVIIARTYLKSAIPNELYEAAKMDGASEFRQLLNIAVPLSKPILAVLALYYGIGHWNAYFDAMIFLKSEELYPLQIVLRGILVKSQINTGQIAMMEGMRNQLGIGSLVKYSVIIVASVPVLMIYPFAQKYFIKGVMIGSLKG